MSIDVKRKKVVVVGRRKQKQLERTKAEGPCYGSGDNKMTNHASQNQRGTSFQSWRRSPNPFFHLPPSAFILFLFSTLYTT